MKKIKNIIVSIGTLLILPLLIIGGSMVAESFESWSITQALIGIAILTVDFMIFLGVIYDDYKKNLWQ